MNSSPNRLLTSDCIRRCARRSASMSRSLAAVQPALSRCHRRRSRTRRAWLGPSPRRGRRGVRRSRRRRSVRMPASRSPQRSHAPRALHDVHGLRERILGGSAAARIERHVMCRCRADCGRSRAPTTAFRPNSGHRAGPSGPDANRPPCTSGAWSPPSASRAAPSHDHVSASSSMTHPTRLLAAAIIAHARKRRRCDISEKRALYVVAPAHLPHWTTHDACISVANPAVCASSSRD